MNHRRLAGVIEEPIGTVKTSESVTTSTGEAPFNLANTHNSISCTKHVASWAKGGGIKFWAPKNS